MKKIILLLIVVFALNTISHPGRTNSAGCHTNRKTGEYHCHGKTSSISSSSKSGSRTTKKKSTSSKKVTTTKKTNSKIKGTGAVSEELYFKDCDEAKKRGYWNIKRGQSGYRKELDPDGNGIACEK